MSDWSSKQYSKFETQRTQPSLDLISRISDIEPKRTLDIGCGPGNSTAALAKAFPDTELIGIDASDNMLLKAREAYPDIRFIRGFIPDDLDKLTGKFDLIFSNACIHWIPDQERLINSVFEKLANNGYFAVQIPMIQEAPFYKLLDNLTALPKWKKLSDVKNFHNLLPEEYYDLFLALNCDFEMWQTSYYHIIDDFKGIIEWYRGSGLRPYLDRLSQSEQENLISDLLDGLKDYYTMQVDGKVLLKMPRLFFVLRKNNIIQ